MEKLIEQFSVGLFFWQTILFLVLLFILKKFAWKPILNAVDEREDSIKESLNAAEKAKADMAAMVSENEALLKEARLERDAMLREAHALKDQIISDAKNTAKDEADKVTAQAQEAILREQKAALTDMKNQISIVAIEVAEKVIRAELADKGKQEELVERLTKEITLN